MPWRDAVSLGVLMNTRGLMELVILNIGLDIGVISPALFSMMVVMALVTTFMAMPLLDLISGPNGWNPALKIAPTETNSQPMALRTSDGSAA